MGYLVSEADIPNLPFDERVCSECKGDGGRKTFITYDDDKVRQENIAERTCDYCQGSGTQHVVAFHLETRRESFVLYTDFGAQSLELANKDLPLLQAYVAYLLVQETRG